MVSTINTDHPIVLYNFELEELIIMILHSNKEVFQKILFNLKTSVFTCYGLLKVVLKKNGRNPIETIFQRASLPCMCGQKSGSAAGVEGGNTVT